MMQKIEQETITEVLEEHGPLSKRELSDRLGCTYTEANNAVVRGHLANELEKVENDYIGEPARWRLSK